MDTYTVPNDINGAITFIAQWSINEYEITYELNGGINAENAPVSYTIETDTITLPVPTKDGYNFEDGIQMLHLKMQLQLLPRFRWIWFYMQNGRKKIWLYIR